ncbi:uncharacterized protein LOC100161964 [Acyrthosiphon pisum]|uniref:O-acyltransferase WSD1 C-terminal domain-containing protein n=1 Tax=Acyrthosiphon pisum TaxID=7029 RepID=A0A8R2JPS1_ACYPI|nr:uncharacterized protein LOC100161964 [Acyrthosiphon pisum]
MTLEHGHEHGHHRQNYVFTWISFVLAVVSTPVLCMCYLTTSIGRFILLRFLKKTYPDLEFIKSVSIRSAMDTPDNTGYVVVLLKVIGDFDINLMKHTIQTDIVEKYDRVSGRLCYPHLRCSLTKKWMRYAWIKTSTFSIDNHVIGLPETKSVPDEDHIMQHVNDILASLIPPELPQWQITMIPVGEDSFYLLVRIHHLYSSEDGIGLSDLLLLKPDDGGLKHGETASVSSSSGQHADADSIQNILSTVYQAPTALPRLSEHLSEICANTWNELVSTYDPLENPKVFRRRPNIFIFGTMLVIVTASAARDKTTRRNFAHKLKREMSRRDIRFRYMCESVVNTFHPVLWVSFTWWLLVKCILRLPITMLLMVKNTSTYVYWTYVLLYSVSELIYLARLIYYAPSTVIRELVLPFLGGPDRGTMRAPEGSKCVCWSRPIDLDLVNTIHDNTGAATCEIQLSMLAAALQEYFAVAGLRFPKNVMTTTRFVSKANLFQLNNRHVVTNGLLALPLPMDTDRDPMYSLHQMQECLQEAIGNQTALYIASMWQIDHSLATSFLPSPMVSYGLHFLSKKFPLTVTYVEEHKLDRKRRMLLWGQEVDAILYWRPPQSNVCMSLSIINYGGHLRLAVMADANMTPSCKEIVSRYEGNIPEFITAAENYAKIVNTSD